MKIRAIIVLLILPSFIFAQSTAELKSDFTIFRSALEEGHPGIYRYNSKATIDSIFDAAEKAITRPMGKREYQLLLSKIVSQIGCGHTAVLAPGEAQDKFDKETTAIPFQPYYSDGKLFVLTNFSSIADKGFIGARMVSINGHSVKALLKEMLGIMPADGRNRTYKYRNLTYSKYFTRYYYYLYGDTAAYTVEYISGGETKVRKAKLTGLLFSELNAIRDKKYPVHFLSDPLEFKITNDKKTAYLKIESFDGDVLEERKLDLPRFLQTAFNRIDSAQVKNLIIDLRNNHGGTDEYGKLLFSYLTPHEFDYYSSLTINTDSFAFFKYTAMAGRKVPAGLIKANTAGSFDVTRHPNIGQTKTYAAHLFRQNLCTD